MTVNRLGVLPTLAGTLRLTNPIESMIEICRDRAVNVTMAGQADGAALMCRRDARSREHSSVASTVTCIYPLSELPLTPSSTRPS